MATKRETKVSLETLVNLAKRRGLVFQTSEIYGGIAGFYDYGPYGAQIVRNLKNAWWQYFVQGRSNIYGLDGAIIQNPKVWEASGHVETFNDPMVECSNCKARLREDHLDNKDKCPVCGKSGTLSKPRPFNLMFQTFIGPTSTKGIEEQKQTLGDKEVSLIQKEKLTYDISSKAYLRPETAGAIFAQFQNVRETTRAKIPFGIAQIGKAFRNEISPRDFLFRVREFEQMEIEFFVRPKDAKDEFADMRELCWRWLLTIGLNDKKLKWYRHKTDERAHYAADSYDIRYEYPFGSDELWGIANRTDYDLRAHELKSGKDMHYFDESEQKKFVPFVIEPSLGVERLFLALLDSAYHEEEVKGEKRIVLKLHKDIAPVQVAVLPLSKDKKLSPAANAVYVDLKDHFICEFDETQSIGRRYRRQDEIGTPFCVTIDFDSLKDKKATIRDRDTMKQQRVSIKDVSKELTRKFNA